MSNLILDLVNGKKVKKVPFWFMRQAGRYLPEYHTEFNKKKSFLDIYYNPDIASKITLQPIQRFDMDAAIVFADILVLPDAMGCKVEFINGKGPTINPITTDFKPNDNFLNKLKPVFQTIVNVKKQLNEKKALIGFAGAPWTVAAYMIEGRSSKNFINTRIWAHKNKKSFLKIIDFLVEYTIEYLKEQKKCGADVIQLFDSWAGILSVEEFHEWVILPTKRIVKEVGNLIGFPKGAGVKYLDYVSKTGIGTVSVDYSLPLEWIRDNLQPLVTVQGNLDPVLLAMDINNALKQLNKIFNILGEGPFIFNLGHGIIKETPVDNVESLVSKLKSINANR